MKKVMQSWILCKVAAFQHAVQAEPALVELYIIFLFGQVKTENQVTMLVTEQQLHVSTIVTKGVL